MFILVGLGSIAFSGHQYHISNPINNLIEAGINPIYIPSPQDILYKSLKENSSNTALISEHHLYVGIIFIIGGIVGLFLKEDNISKKVNDNKGVSTIGGSFHGQLGLNLFLLGVISTLFAHIQNAIPVYPNIVSDYSTTLALFVHHMWIGGFLIVGAGAHISIYSINNIDNQDLKDLLKHRDVIVSHLIWITVALGLHSFGIYIHNDTLQALGRPEDTFSDNSIQIKPIFAILLNKILSKVYDIEVLDGRVTKNIIEMGTADFMIHHIHAFTVHVTILIIFKGILYGRSSRLVSDKHILGFRYPCDGPGRGGTCQISSWDHIYLGVFWMYNSVSIILFHYYWKMQSDVWAIKYDTNMKEKIIHISGGDYSSNSININGWLRNFLWSQSAQVIQSYGSSLSSYGLIFLGAHFVWALSLMFLFSGRGYWQELIESIVWAHYKLKIVMKIQPRALSITQGRAVGVTHYMLGGIGTTWSFFLARIIALSN
jgi:photosystem I P700 chlorophyll a apoprotein A1